MLRKTYHRCFFIITIFTILYQIEIENVTGHFIYDLCVEEISSVGKPVLYKLGGFKSYFQCILRNQCNKQKKVKPCVINNTRKFHKQIIYIETRVNISYQKKIILTITNSLKQFFYRNYCNFLYIPMLILIDWKLGRFCTIR